ncbi:hypothetical protein Tco_1190475, partial [Tanacetum coccineum]
TQWEQHEEAAVSYADLKASNEEYYDENVAHRDQTNKLVETTMITIGRSSTTIKDLNQCLNVITKLLKDISTTVKDDPATKNKIDEAIETFAKISTNTTEVVSLVKNFDFSTLQSTMKDLQALSHPVYGKNTRMRHNDSHCTRYKIIPYIVCKSLFMKFTIL